MKTEKKEKLEAAGWMVSDSREFLPLTPDEAEFVEIKLALARRLRLPGGWIGASLKATRPRAEPPCFSPLLRVSA